MLRLRLGLVALGTALVASVGAIAACGSFSSGAAAFGGNGGDDGGQPDASTDASGFDSPFGDVIAQDAPEADAPPDTSLPEPPGVLFVQGSPSLGDQVFCWTVGTGQASMTDRPYPWANPMPASNYPGVPVGGAAALADASSMLGGDLTVYALDASAVASAIHGLDCNATHDCSCFNLLQSNSGVDKSAKHQMPVIPAGTIAPGSTVVLLLRGCFGTGIDPAASVQRCGADWNASTGNLRVDAVPVPGATLPPPSPGALAVQAAQLSPALALLAGDAGAVVSFGAQGAMDAGVVSTLSATGQVLPQAPVQVANGIPLASYGQLGFAVDVGGGATHLWMSLAQSLDLVDPTQDPSQYFTQPTSYLVTVIGDPAGVPPGGSPDASYDGTGLHLLVLPLP